MSRGPKTILELQRFYRKPDGRSSYKEVWTGVRRIKGTLVAFNAVERVWADKDTVYATHTFYCNSPIGLTITEKDRFVSFKKGGREFDIEFVDDVAERKRHLEIDLLEVT